MDIRNRHHEPFDFALMRAEHVAVVAVCSALVILHVREVDWLRFAIAFVTIDLIGYVPGAIAFRRSHGAPIARVFHALYNATHCYLFWTAIVSLWAWSAGGFEWAMLAVPIHLSGDRGIFGNVFKPSALPFEPHGHSRSSASPSLAIRREADE